jgi:hypothetical protein
MAIDISDLPITSPHGSDFGYHAQILGLASTKNAAHGTATSQREKGCAIPCQIECQGAGGSSAQLNVHERMAGPLEDDFRTHLLHADSLQLQSI